MLLKKPGQWNSSMSAPSAPSQRQLRVGEQIRHMIAETLQRGHFRDEILVDNARNVTVSEVRMTPDLKNARAYVMTLGGKDMDTVLPALNDAASYFQKELGHKLKIKFTPRIRFVTDDSYEQANKIETILKNIHDEKENH